MYEMEQFAQGAVLLLLLTGVSLFTAVSPYLCLLLAGILLVVYAIRGLSDDRDRLLIAVQVILSAVFVLVSGNVWGFLVGYECRLYQNRMIRVFIPALLYSAVCIVMQVFVLPNITGQEFSLPQMLWNLLMLLAISGMLGLAEYLLTSYITARNQIAQAVSVTAVNELYEKKLNQELVMKNYLADKNVRLEERENISRNIHNSVGHSITAAIMTLDAADMLFDSEPEKAREKMNAANERIRASLASIRHAVRVLDSESQFVSISDLVTELTAVTDDFVMDTTILVRNDFTDIQPEVMVPCEHAEFLTGTLQELLANGVRHGNANCFTVGLVVDSGHVKLYVTDNGRSDFSAENSADRIRNGFGLKKLVSYTKRCGGSAIFTNENGFRSDIILPLHKEEEYE